MDKQANTGVGLLVRRTLTAEEQARKTKLINAGTTAFDGDDFAKALDCFHRASVIDSADAKVWSMVGLAYANLEFPREAWRSFKLGLVCDPDDVNTLWYAAEFLYNNEDYALARLLLERYIGMEEDPQRREEAQDMLAESIRQLGDDTQLESAGLFEQREDDEAEQDEELDGFDVEDAFADDDLEEDEEDDSEDDIYEDDSEAEFVASLGLELSGMLGRCPKCSVGLPQDAPFCYSCFAPHFYGDV